MFAAIDLGTNNCRLLIASPRRRGFRVVDAFSRIVRLGEGVARSGRLSEPAMDRALSALDVCAGKIRRWPVDGVRCVATAACRSAENAEDFIDRVHDKTGLQLEVITPEREARLAAKGCADLLDPARERALIFDIGGGSTELIWVRRRPIRRGQPPRPPAVEAWTSIPYGVVTATELSGGSLDDGRYRELRSEVQTIVEAFRKECQQVDSTAFHLLGTSGTVTSLAGMHLGLPRYDRSKVDGLWMKRGELIGLMERVQAMSLAERAKQPCVGPERSGLLVTGCALVHGIMDAFPSDAMRIADRGLREGLLMGLAERRRRAARRKKTVHA